MTELLHISVAAREADQPGLITRRKEKIKENKQIVFTILSSKKNETTEEYFKERGQNLIVLFLPVPDSVYMLYKTS